ncbi:MAG: hypothetical protein A2Y63_01400 [Candidatus Riflebacteria bacterium RBG_13_59_9]|nr:MAG: hypothetical protein A2Y63_01400 [Candidatus Riflebacteria bacterium RBG_13_59_9]
MSGESSLGDVLRAYWDSLPENKKRKLNRTRHLLAAFSLIDDRLQGFSAPAALLEENGREILVLFASNSTALKALRHRARDLPTQIEEVLGLHVDEVRVAFRPQSQVNGMRDRHQSGDRQDEDQD